MGFDSFDGCESLKKIILNSDLKEIKIIDKIPDCLKIVVVGGPNVGKTCIIERITKNGFPDTMITLSVDFKTKMLDINGICLKLQSWDTSSIEKNLIITKAYFRGMHGVIIVLDLTNRNSLNYSNMFFEEIKEQNITAPSMILGNECDLKHNVYDDDIKELVNKYNSKYFDVLAKDNYNIEDAIMYIGNEIAGNIITDCRSFQFKHLIYYNDSNSNEDSKKCNIY